MVAYNTVKMTTTYFKNNLLTNISSLKHEQNLCLKTFCETGFSIIAAASNEN